jgi:hypothetical protein
MGAVGLGKAGQSRAEIWQIEPPWQPLAQHAAFARDHQNHARACCGLTGDEGRKHGASAILRMAVKIETCGNIDLPAPHPPFAAAIGRRRGLARLGGRVGFWRSGFGFF